MIQTNTSLLKIIIIFLFIIPFNNNAQENLVLNPSFEEFNSGIEPSCTAYTSELFSQTLMYWKSPSIGSPDLLNINIDETCPMHPLNPILANQSPRTGSSYSGIINQDTPPNNIFREYIQGSLSSVLEIGKKYHIKFYVSLGEASGRITNNIGIKFLKNEASFNTTSILGIIPDANHKKILPINKLEWTEISLEFTPIDPDLKYFIIGNFYDSDDTDFELVEGLVHPDFYYYLIDDVSIYKAITPIFNEMGPYCLGADFELPTISLNNIEGTWSPKINNQQTTTYTFTPNDNDYTTTQITIEILPEFDFEITQFCKNQTLWLTIKEDTSFNVNNSKVTWEINGIKYDSKEVNLNDQSLIIGSVKVINENGCSKTKEFDFKISSNPCLIPKGISPNGDGFNDFLDLSNLNVKNIKIFNRYGTLVYNKKDYQNQWKGQSNHENLLPSGSYFYSIKTYNGETFTGWIQLISETN